MIQSKFKSILTAGLILSASSIFLNACKDEEKDPTPTDTGKEIVLTSKTDGIASFEGYDVTTKTLTLKAINTYKLDGKVYVNDGQSLTIEPGTVIKATERGNSDATVLVIARGGKINAIGTVEKPIIFTAEADDLAKTTDLPLISNALWGGIAICGNAPTGGKNNNQELLEGLDENDSRSFFGGTASADNSGTLKYVSIRYTGAEIAQGNEIQGLTLGGVGTGTTIDYVEVFGSSDDGIEIFGGTVDIKHFAVWGAEDDDYDLDLGWRGQGQFWFSLKRADKGDHQGEWDGAIPDDNTIYTKSNIFNATFIGSGVGSANADNDLGIILRDGAAINFCNSIVTDINGKGVAVEDRNEDFDSYKKFLGNESSFKGNIWNVGGFTTLDASLTGILIASNDGKTPREAAITSLIAHFATGNNSTSSAGIKVSRVADKGLDPRPTHADATTNLAAYPAGLTQVNYKGAFEPGKPTWLSGWSALSQLGLLVD